MSTFSRALRISRSPFGWVWVSRLSSSAFGPPTAASGEGAPASAANARTDVQPVPTVFGAAVAGRVDGSAVTCSGMPAGGGACRTTRRGLVAAQRSEDTVLPFGGVNRKTDAAGL